MPNRNSVSFCTAFLGKETSKSAPGLAKSEGNTPSKKIVTGIHGGSTGDDMFTDIPELGEIPTTVREVGKGTGTGEAEGGSGAGSGAKGKDEKPLSVRRTRRARGMGRKAGFTTATTEFCVQECTKTPVKGFKEGTGGGGETLGDGDTNVLQRLKSTPGQAPAKGTFSVQLQPSALTLAACTVVFTRKRSSHGSAESKHTKFTCAESVVLPHTSPPLNSKPVMADVFKATSKQSSAGVRTTPVNTPREATRGPPPRARK